MGTPGVIIRPDHDRAARSKNTLILIHIANLVLHHKARTTNFSYTYTHLGMIRTHQGKLIRTGDLFDEHTIMCAKRSGLYTWIMWFIIFFLMLVFFLRRPSFQPRLKLAEIMTSSFLKIDEIHGIVDVRQWIKVAKANLYWIPAGIGVYAHVPFSLSSSYVT